MTTAIMLSLSLLAAIVGVVGFLLWRRQAARDEWLPLDPPTLVPGLKYKSPFPADPLRLGRAADRAVHHLATVEGWGLTRCCEVLSGLHIRVMPTMSWTQASGQKVGGELTTEDGLIVARVCSDLSSLAHEFAHVLQNAIDGRTDVVSHGDWEARGITAADNRFRDELAREGEP